MPRQSFGEILGILGRWNRKVRVPLLSVGATGRGQDQSQGKLPFLLELHCKKSG